MHLCKRLKKIYINKYQDEINNQTFGKHNTVKPTRH